MADFDCDYDEYQPDEYSDAGDEHQFLTPDPSENGDEEEENDSISYASYVSPSEGEEEEEDASVSTVGSVKSESEDDEEEEEDASSGSESEDETVDPAEADPIQFPISIHICFPNDEGRCIHRTCENRRISSFFHICPYGMDGNIICNRFGCRNFGRGFDQRDCPFFRTISQICRKPDCPYFGMKHSDVPVTPRYIPSKRSLENAVMPSAKKS